MPIMLLNLLYVAVATAALLLVRTLAASWRRRNLATKHGCRPPSKYPHTSLFGWDLYQARVNAEKAGRRNKFDLELFQKCGPTYQERQGLKRVILTMETANFHAIGATQFHDFGREQSERRAARAFFGKGIPSMNGNEWKHYRSLVTPLFTRAQLTDIERFQKFVDRTLELIPRDGKAVDMQPLLQKLFLDSSTEFIFGQSIDSLRDKSGKPEEFRQAFNLALEGAGKRMSMGGTFAFTYMLDKTWKQNYLKVHAFIDEAIARHSNKCPQNEEANLNSSDRYVLIEGMAKEIKDPVELRFQLLNIFFPARDASAIAVSNALFFLARHPHIWQDLRSEALKLGDQPLTFELLKGLSSFRYTLFEAIRLQGPSGQTRRFAMRDTTLPRGGGPDGSAPLFIPKGTLVYMNNFPKTRDPTFWGDDVEAFRPSRFKGKLLNWEFTPFFGGPRICPALNQVITQSVYLLVRLVLEFEAIENKDECYEYVETTRMLVESKNGVKVALYPARSEE